MARGLSWAQLENTKNKPWSEISKYIGEFEQKQVCNFYKFFNNELSRGYAMSPLAVHSFGKFCKL